jgi:hypothetical protein
MLSEAYFQHIMPAKLAKLHKLCALRARDTHFAKGFPNTQHRYSSTSCLTNIMAAKLHKLRAGQTFFQGISQYLASFPFIILSDQPKLRAIALASKVLFQHP